MDTMYEEDDADFMGRKGKGFLVFKITSAGLQEASRDSSEYAEVAQAACDHSRLHGCGFPALTGEFVSYMMYPAIVSTFTFAAEIVV